MATTPDEKKTNGKTDEKITKADDKVGELEKRIGELQKQIEKERKEGAELLATAEADTAKARQEIAQLNRQLDEKQKKLAAVGGPLKSIIKDLKATNILVPLQFAQKVIEVDQLINNAAK